jgi:G3E family GTPase
MKTDKIESSGRPDVSSAVIKLIKPISIENLNLFIRKYSLTTYRMKGYAFTSEGPVAIQTSFERIEMRPLIDNQYYTEIVMIGPDIDQKIVQQEFEYLCNLN